MDDVRLPPWAQGDAFEFVRIHREALESDYVSEVRNKYEGLIHAYVHTFSYLLACMHLDKQYNAVQCSKVQYSTVQ